VLEISFSGIHPAAARVYSVELWAPAGLVLAIVAEPELDFFGGWHLYLVNPFTFRHH